jgi:hypothetical protein
MKIKMLTSAVVCLPGGISQSFPSGKVVEINDKIAKSLINGKLAIETDEEIEIENQPMATISTAKKIEELINKKPVVVKRKKAVKQKPVKNKK